MECHWKLQNLNLTDVTLVWHLFNVLWSRREAIWRNSTRFSSSSFLYPSAHWWERPPLSCGSLVRQRIVRGSIYLITYNLVHDLSWPYKIDPYWISYKERNMEKWIWFTFAGSTDTFTIHVFPRDVVALRINLCWAPCSFLVVT